MFRATWDDLVLLVVRVMPSLSGRLTRTARPAPHPRKEIHLHPPEPIRPRAELAPVGAGAQAGELG
jgi:hypothetical protein